VRTKASGSGAYVEEEAAKEGELQPKLAEAALLTRETCNIKAEQHQCRLQFLRILLSGVSTLRISKPKQEATACGLLETNCEGQSTSNQNGTKTLGTRKYCAQPNSIL
jgi:hypothetical protein